MLDIDAQEDSRSTKTDRKTNLYIREPRFYFETLRVSIHGKYPRYLASFSKYHRVKAMDMEIERLLLEAIKDYDFREIKRQGWLKPTVPIKQISHFGSHLKIEFVYPIFKSSCSTFSLALTQSIGS